MDGLDYIKYTDGSIPGFNKSFLYMFSFPLFSGKAR